MLLLLFYSENKSVMRFVLCKLFCGLFVFVISFFTLTQCVFAQGNNQDPTPTESVHIIRNYYQSLSLTVNDQSVSTFKTGSYGEQISASNSQEQIPYSFSSQEYDSKLGLYFFPGRVYSPSNKRFFQPDPKHQYFSPYVFVKGDPANIIDKNGKEGKPLYLYGEQHNYPTDVSSNAGIFDLKNEMPDAYSFPMHQFVNNEIPDLPEWNGNVFLMSHMDPNEGSFNLEEADVIEDLRSNNDLVRKGVNPMDDKAYSYIDSEDMGSLLQKFGEERNVPVRNIAIGGCGGGKAAQKIGKGFKRSEGFGRKTKLKATGVRSDYNTTVAGPYSSSMQSDEIPLSHSRLNYRPGNYSTFNEYDRNDDGTLQYDRQMYRDEGGGEHESGFIEGDDLQDFMRNARVPPHASEDFSTFHFFY